MASMTTKRTAAVAMLATSLMVGGAAFASTPSPSTLHEKGESAQTSGTNPLDVVHGVYEIGGNAIANAVVNDDRPTR